jgi:glutamyl-tRNA synthetase
VRDDLANASAWDVEAIEAVLRARVDELGVKPKEIFQPIRVALTGTTVSPGIFESVAALGRDETLARLDKALRRADSGPL